ncbi:hypothetical protein [Teichococcus coralli]|uniref:hypothetical protein n=1 Tax=Teichococcus coralli TaxID=2545983 RepID=UPI00136F56ED|nr:hypothetical protein [Pseudoroseomonas coralli]
MRRLHILLRLVWVRASLAWGEWCLRRHAAVIEQAAGLPRGWLLIGENAERFRAWEATRTRWRAAQEVAHARR